MLRYNTFNIKMVFFQHITFAFNVTITIVVCLMYLTHVLYNDENKKQFVPIIMSSLVVLGTS